MQHAQAALTAPSSPRPPGPIRGREPDPGNRPIRQYRVPAPYLTGRVSRPGSRANNTPPSHPPTTPNPQGGLSAPEHRPGGPPLGRETQGRKPCRYDHAARRRRPPRGAPPGSHLAPNFPKAALASLTHPEGRAFRPQPRAPKLHRPPPLPSSSGFDRPRLRPPGLSRGATPPPGPRTSRPGALVTLSPARPGLPLARRPAPLAIATHPEGRAFRTQPRAPKLHRPKSCRKQPIRGSHRDPLQSFKHRQPTS